MIFRRLKISFMGLGFASFLAYLALSTGIQYLKYVHDQQQSSEKFLSVAIGTSLVQLAGLLDEVTNDQTIFHNVDWKLQNSAARTLTAHLRTSELDGIQVFDQHCDRLVYATTDRLLDLNDNTCKQAKETEPGTSKLIWQGAVGELSPVLHLLRFGVSKEALTVVGSVALNKEWAHLYPEIWKAINARQFDIVMGEQRPQLKIDQHKKTLIYAYYLAKDALENIKWLCLLASLGCLSMAVYRNIRVTRRLATEVKQFTRWCFDLDSKTKTMPLKEGDLNEAQHVIKQALQDRHHEIRLHKERRAVCEATIQKQVATLRECHATIAELSAYESLTVQTKTALASLSTGFASLRHDWQNLQESLESQIVQGCDNLQREMSDWQAQIATVGARKFIRSMAETTANAAESILDRRLATFLKTVSELNIAAQNLVAHAAATSRKMQQLQKNSALQGLTRSKNLSVETKSTWG